MIGLCFRCEHRAKYMEKWLEAGKAAYIPAPRIQCNNHEMSVGSCYAFRPVEPIVVDRAESEKRLNGKKRPVLGPEMLSARVEAIGPVKAALKARKMRKGWALWWQPEED